MITAKTPIPSKIGIAEIVAHMNEKRNSEKNLFQKTMDFLQGKSEVDVGAVRDEKYMIDLLNTIKNNETGIVKGDKYAFRKFSGDEEMGDDIGAYQVTTAELKSWSKDFTGKQIDPEEFAQNAPLQDEYMRSKVKALKGAGASTEEILALHRGGLTGYADPKIRAQRVVTRQEYVNKGIEFLKTLQEPEEGGRLSTTAP